MNFLWLILVIKLQKSIVCTYQEPTGVSVRVETASSRHQVELGGMNLATPDLSLSSSERKTKSAEHDGEKASLVLSCSTMDKSKQVEMNPPPLSVHVGQSSTEMTPYSQLRQVFCLSRPLPKSLLCIYK